MRTDVCQWCSQRVEIDTDGLPVRHVLPVLPGKALGSSTVCPTSPPEPRPIGRD